MLIVDNLAIAGRHLPLLNPTSFAVARGELLLVQAEPQPTRTALALGASARMRPDEGTVSWLGDPSLKAVRRISALVDSPEINEPEAHLKVSDLVAEDLALQPGSVWRRSGVNAWMHRHHMEALADQWLDAIDPLDRLRLLTHLALEDRAIELLVFDAPDRHGIPEDDWCNYLSSIATGRRAPAVIGILQRLPDKWLGSTAYAGRIQEKLVVPGMTEHEELALGVEAPKSEAPIEVSGVSLVPSGEEAPLASGPVASPATTEDPVVPPAIAAGPIDDPGDGETTETTVLPTAPKELP